jgi:hypothetical protein
MFALMPVSLERILLPQELEGTRTQSFPVRYSNGT